jgi:hypothetical protein
LRGARRARIQPKLALFLRSPFRGRPNSTHGDIGLRAALRPRKSKSFLFSRPFACLAGNIPDVFLLFVAVADV